MAVSSYWQHETPLKCPSGHQMIWLGSCYWICCKCRGPKGGCGRIYVELHQDDAALAKEQ